MNTQEKLLKFADHIESMEHADHIEDTEHDYAWKAKEGKNKFNMSGYATVATDNDGNICGTICCIAGEAVRKFDPEAFERSLKKQEDLEFQNVATDLLGITEEQGNDLFFGKFSHKHWSEITPEEAAIAIREVAEEYK